MMDVLVFLPVDKVSEGIVAIFVNCLKQNCPIGTKDLLQYFEEYYVEGTSRKVRKKNSLILRRILLLFKPELWNVNNISINQRRTFNACEEINNINLSISLNGQSKKFLLRMALK